MTNAVTLDLAGAFGAPDRCPSCGAGDRLEEQSDGDAVAFRCTACGDCWHVELGWVWRNDPHGCTDCDRRDECMSRRAEQG